MPEVPFPPRLIDAATAYLSRAVERGDVIQYEGTNRSDVAAFLGDAYGFTAPCVVIDGERRVRVGEWILRTSDGFLVIGEGE